MRILLLIGVFFLAACITQFYITLARHKKWVDIPNMRSSHTMTTPRGGGLVFVSIWFFAAVLAIFLSIWTFRQACILLPGVVIVALVGFYDDRHPLPAKHRSFFYLLASILAVVAMGGVDHLQLGENLHLPLGLIGSVLAVIAIAWSANLFNFMDGIDAIAAVETVFTLGVGGIFLWLAGGKGMAFIAWLLVAATGGFLIWNRPPAKVFMGDVGSVTLGFVIMVLAFWGEKQYGVPVILWLILYGVFIYDATLTLFRRVFARENWYQAHRSHAYQRLHQAGWSHGKIVIAIIFVNLLLTTLAVFGFYYQDAIVVLGFAALFILTCAYLLVERIEPMAL